MSDELELGDETPTQMCPRCKTHTAVRTPTPEHGLIEVEHCPACGFAFERLEDGDVDTVLQYLNGDAPRSDLEEIAAAIRQTSAARGIDSFAVDQSGISAADWAEMTERDRTTVARNVRRAQTDLDDDA